MSLSVCAHALPVDELYPLLLGMILGRFCKRPPSKSCGAEKLSRRLWGDEVALINSPFYAAGEELGYIMSGGPPPPPQIKALLASRRYLLAWILGKSPEGSALPYQTNPLQGWKTNWGWWRGSCKW